MSDIKSDQRKRAFAARKVAHADGQGDATQHLLAEVLRQPPGIIAAYMPIRTEIDTMPAMLALAEMGHVICVPVIVAKAQPLEFHVWTPDTPMIAGPFGAQIPAKAQVLQPDTLIVPLVAYDETGNRLGYGGGFYDRSLERLRAMKPVRAIGFAFAQQQVPLTPEPTDQRLDVVVTQHGSLAPSAVNG